jgi:hypothetical protein
LIEGETRWVSSWPSGLAVDGAFLVGGRVVSPEDFAAWKEVVSEGLGLLPEKGGRLVNARDYGSVLAVDRKRAALNLPVLEQVPHGVDAQFLVEALSFADASGQKTRGTVG